MRLPIPDQSIPAAAAANKGAKAEHRKLAAEMLSWFKTQQ